MTNVEKKISNETAGILLKKKCNLSLKPKRKGEMLTTYGDNKYLRKIIKFKKFTPIKIGIKKTVLWFYNYKDKRSINF